MGDSLELWPENTVMKLASSVFNVFFWLTTGFNNVIIAASGRFALITLGTKYHEMPFFPSPRPKRRCYSWRGVGALAEVDGLLPVVRGGLDDPRAEVYWD